MQEETEVKRSKIGQSTQCLINHIHSNHGLNIDSENYCDLLSMGYYHGYKRYRYIKKANSDGRLRLQSFNEVIAIYKFDMSLKELFYPLLMVIETGLKNRAIESLVSGKSSGLDDFFNCQMNLLSDYDINHSKFLEVKERYDDTCKNIHDTVKYYSDKNDSIKHYLKSDYQIPIWVLFEVITFGQFSKILSCITRKSREDLHKSFEAIPNITNDMELIVNSLIELRNATMHNNAIFDANFSSGVPKKIKNQIKNELNLSNFQCTFIEDYFILVIWAMSKLAFPKDSLCNYMMTFCNLVRDFDKSLNNRDILFRIVSTNYKSKIQSLNLFLDNMSPVL